jgi:hypothetical protein
MDKYFFLGEFGCLNTCVLGTLEKVERPIQVFTYPDYFTIMKKVKPNVVEADVPFKAESRYDACRSWLDVDDPELYGKLREHGYDDLKHLLIDTCPWDIERTWMQVFVPITKPIVSNYPVPPGKYVSVCCRKRQWDSFRNTPVRIWHRLFELLRQDDFTIVFHGLAQESYDFTNEAPRKHICTNIDEAVAYLNNSICYVGSAYSGYNQFAGSCRCHVVSLKCNSHVDWQFYWNPFGRLWTQPLDADEAYAKIHKCFNPPTHWRNR